MENTSDSTASLFGWMAWTPEVAIVVICLGLKLAGMTVWQCRSPSIARKGFLPMPTTRGDRLFIGLLTAAYVNLAWAGFTEMQQAIGAAISFVLLVIVMRWG